MNYRIKPLVWEKASLFDGLRVETPMGAIVIVLEYPWTQQVTILWPEKWNLESVLWPSYDKAKAAAEEEYRKRLLTMLEEVEP